MTVSLYWWARVAAAAALLAASTPAFSADFPAGDDLSNESNWYASVHGGLKFGEDWDDHWNNGDIAFEFDDGWRIGATIGYSLSSIFAVEGEVSYMRQELDADQAAPVLLAVDCCDEGDASIVTGMVNLVAGGFIGGGIRPYVGAGAGLAHVAFNGVDVPAAFDLDDSDLVFAAQGLAGLDFMVGPRFAIGARYRFLHLGDVELQDDGHSRHVVDPDFIQSVEAVFTVGF
jgi:opacity protein-like surface antigen